ncbi:MAG TPA: GNAT family N-acetyltransferase [Ktedonobacterales bacterium]|nr:GNAT family N-acetyltransferase [Ktedonobacterales bacterium]
MDAPTYRRASTLPLEYVATAFNHSFEGYFVPMSHTVDSLRRLIEVNDVSLAHSFVAVDDGGQPGGIVLLAIRGARGWIGGMGLAPEWRGRGQSAPLMRVALEEARTVGLASVELEVLAQNTPARRLYSGLGFENVRSLAVFTGPLASDVAVAREPVPLPVREIPVERALADFAVLHQMTSPWQREIPSLTYMAASLRATALLDGEVVRASLISMDSGAGVSIMDFGSRAATVDERRSDALALIRALVTPTPGAPVRAINIPPGDPLGDALVTLGCPIPHTQWEMLLRLN